MTSQGEEGVLSREWLSCPPSVLAEKIGAITAANRAGTITRNELRIMQALFARHALPHPMNWTSDGQLLAALGNRNLTGVRTDLDAMVGRDWVARAYSSTELGSRGGHSYRLTSDGVQALSAGTVGGRGDERL